MKKAILRDSDGHYYMSNKKKILQKVLLGVLLIWKFKYGTICYKFV